MNKTTPARDTRTDGMDAFRERMAAFHSAQQIGSEKRKWPRSAEDMKHYGPWKKAAGTATLLALLTGCIPQQVKTQGAAVADGMLDDSVYALCIAATKGSELRRWGYDPEGQAAVDLLCEHEYKRGIGGFRLQEQPK